ncbi:MAG: hypothetical protein K2G88_06250 [Oscillospiraceae bacterium]|nr:hypothetical protein [Oscillospiraceae bacterium]MDE6004970.1 hypothetical protein [Oscillospiraceae bacterium]
MTNLEKLNQFTRRELQENEVYLFDVILCDNNIDRDLECFSNQALEQMQKLFIGKTGIFDHNLKSNNQTARIYDTELVKSDKLTKDGRQLISLKAHAYMIRTDSNADFIREIDGGIKKEVSVSCCAEKRICSICGADKRETTCNHIIGKQYGDKYCYIILDDIQDAYEWSFVAVPAQLNAGVTKHFQHEVNFPQTSTELNQLLSELELQMRTEVFQLCGKQSNGAISKALRTATDKMDLQELLHFKQMLLEEQKQDISQAYVQLADFQQR